MKKVLKTIGIIILVILALIALLFIKAALTPAVPKNYTENVKTGGEIEKRYLSNGSYSVGYYEQNTDEDFKKYEIWYPDALKDAKSSFPVIVVLNGTGVKASKYKEQFRLFASWGFVVIGTEEEESWDAVATDRSLEDNIAAAAMIYPAVSFNNNVPMLFALFDADEVKDDQKQKELLELVDMKNYVDNSKDIPQFIAWGTKDTMVGTTETHAYIEKAKEIGADVTEIIVENQGHGFGQEYYMKDFLEWYNYAVRNE